MTKLQSGNGVDAYTSPAGMQSIWSIFRATFARRRAVLPQALLIFLFLAFYLPIEFVFWQRLHTFGAVDVLVTVLISFLNLIPAGIFSFSVMALLPDRFSARTDEAVQLERPGQIASRSRVAVLYTTYNDFMAEHAEYDAEEAARGGLPFFILDDSSDEAKRRQIDAFAEEHGCEVVRRAGRKGYKAGAINAWVEKFGGGFEYFFILDSDSLASVGAIFQCLAPAERDPSLAVVQSKTLTMTSAPSRFTSSAVTIQHAYMEIVQKAMRNLGTSPYYGHNALVSVQSIRDVGGFVEESNEDYKTLTKLNERGYRSVYADHAITWEEVPPDYFSARKRAMRWARDAVPQLGLVRSSTPIPIAFFLFYGWVTHMSNAILLVFLFIVSAASLHIFNSAMIEVAGSLALSVIVLWPLVALLSTHEDLTPSKLLKALLWGSVYNIPMIAPLSYQIFRSSVSRVASRLKATMGKAQRLREEFVVTPKRNELRGNAGSIVSRLRLELFVGMALVSVFVLSGNFYSMVFAVPQVLSILVLPLLIYRDSKGAAAGEGAEEPIAKAQRPVSRQSPGD